MMNTILIMQYGLLNHIGRRHQKHNSSVSTEEPTRHSLQERTSLDEFL